MNHQPVNSSRIASVGYDEKTATLEIRFYQTGILRYRGVPPHIYQNFLTVVSKGRFYDGVIKGKFPEIKSK
ncbi:KTSC domain-containing protein [Citrobacter amalonaticus]|uniref:KTSC domain-containing protein n=1 Tax=Citrobacter amalonaticus TaxID=35703 RepID=UPI00300DA2E7